jgi:hypothetical protein
MFATITYLIVPQEWCNKCGWKLGAVDTSGNIDGSRWYNGNIAIYTSSTGEMDAT